MDQMIEPGLIEVRDERSFDRWNTVYSLWYQNQLLGKVGRETGGLLGRPKHGMAIFGERQLLIRRAARDQPHTAELVDEQGLVLATATVTRRERRIEMAGTLFFLNMVKRSYDESRTKAPHAYVTSADGRILLEPRWSFTLFYHHLRCVIVYTPLPTLTLFILVAFITYYYPFYSK
ncbi:hypothetical protein [Kallotenue papyrolyticum]|uniref:hypothetical protein n=1 Tax=Kallotenue papyrolyticum TaxID=1325125 RepID=UPI0004929AD1|nr:hypothetical protein [Kallotenue papyrolyticum]